MYMYMYEYNISREGERESDCQRSVRVKNLFFYKICL